MSALPSSTTQQQQQRQRQLQRLQAQQSAEDAQRADTDMGRSSRRGSKKQRKPRRKRTKLTDEQLQVLEDRFAVIQSAPNTKEAEVISQQIGLPVPVIKAWYSNRRAKDRRLRRKGVLPGRSNSSSSRGGGGRGRAGSPLGGSGSGGRGSAGGFARGYSWSSSMSHSMSPPSSASSAFGAATTPTTGYFPSFPTPSSNPPSPATGGSGGGGGDGSPILAPASSALAHSSSGGSLSSRAASYENLAYTAPQVHVVPSPDPSATGLARSASFSAAESALRRGYSADFPVYHSAGSAAPAYTAGDYSSAAQQQLAHARLLQQAHEEGLMQQQRQQHQQLIEAQMVAPPGHDAYHLSVQSPSHHHHHQHQQQQQHHQHHQHSHSHSHSHHGGGHHTHHHGVHGPVPTTVYQLSGGSGVSASPGDLASVPSYASGGSSGVSLDTSGLPNYMVSPMTGSVNVNVDVDVGMGASGIVGSVSGPAAPASLSLSAFDGTGDSAVSGSAGEPTLAPSPSTSELVLANTLNADTSGTYGVATGGETHSLFERNSPPSPASMAAVGGDATLLTNFVVFSGNAPAAGSSDVPMFQNMGLPDDEALLEMWYSEDYSLSSDAETGVSPTLSHLPVASTPLSARGAESPGSDWGAGSGFGSGASSFSPSLSPGLSPSASMPSMSASGGTPFF